MWCLNALAEKDRSNIEVSVDEFYTVVDHVTKTMVHDFLSPPVVSRVYFYPDIAVYKIIALYLLKKAA